MAAAERLPMRQNLDSSPMSQISSRTVEYRIGSDCFEGLATRDESRKGRLPTVLVCHAWGGRDEFCEEVSRKLAGLGYLAFAVDLYGAGRRGSTPEECGALMTPLVEDRALLRTRLLASHAAAASMTEADPGRMAAVGYCFGGLCALDLARAGAAGLRGVVSFHGLFMPPSLGPQGRIVAKVLALHGWQDPMVPPEAVLGLARELTGASADWQLVAYGHAQHAFTNPQAADPGRGIVYEPRADRRSWAAMQAFLQECLAGE
jgi:dienelactone hydrolase